MKNANYIMQININVLLLFIIKSSFANIKYIFIYLLIEIIIYNFIIF